MIGKVLTKVFGSKNDRILKTIQPLVIRVNELESTVSSLDDAALAARTVEFRERVATAEDLHRLFPEPFAPLPYASMLTLGASHSAVPLFGSVILPQGRHI